MLDYLFKQIDPKKFGFVDKCASGSDRGLGIICGVYVFILIVSLIIMSISSIYNFNKFKNNGVSSLSYVIYFGITLLWQLFGIIFMINACKMCNGLYGFFFIFIVGILISVITMVAFKNITKLVINESKYR